MAATRRSAVLLLPPRLGSPSFPTSLKFSLESAKVMDGKLVAKKIREEIGCEISRMKDAIGVVRLAGIHIGDRKDFGSFLRTKKTACESVGINYFDVNLRKNCKLEDLISYISSLNDDPLVHGIFFRLLLPSHMSRMYQHIIFDAISPNKNVDDALHHASFGGSEKKPLFVPCVPRGCIELLHSYSINVQGKLAPIILGANDASQNPWWPLFCRSLLPLICFDENAIVFVCPPSANPLRIARKADIIISAHGKANSIKKYYPINPRAVVIDLGFNPIQDKTSFRGFKLVGDVDYEQVSKIASAISPVPGGVGPMAIAMLLSNTLLAAKLIHSFH